MYTFISVLIMLAALLLIFIVMIQNSKGGGLAAGFSSSNQIMGVRKTTDFLEKATWGLAGFVVLACIGITAFIEREERVHESEIRQSIEDATVVDPSIIAPNFGTAQQPVVSDEDIE
ncbi:MAG: preprotein translocase subunit SecG [Tannerellaceae bacterium]|nr:preprotein translocase subunit SecG [Tannerellaceae bacterium]